MSKLAKNNLFATPESFEALLDWIEGALPPEHRATGMVIAGMTNNLIAQELEKDEAKAVCE